ncbi:MAG: efflux RND transporter periplasmic adaptor subunit [Pseudomonadales bacterium]|nr:efflux RND transporter periplasmic adaptor subunit [Pseudomonadales bacterium]
MSRYFQPHLWVTYGLLAVALAACTTDPEPIDLSNSAVTPTSYQLQTALVTQRTLPLFYAAPGTVVAKDQLQISSRITGYIDQLNVSEGDQIEPGDLLVKIDGTQVEAAIRSAKAGTQAANAELQDARADIKRYQALSKTKALSPEQLQNAEVRQRQAEASLAQAEGALISAEQDLRSILLTSPVQAQVRERLRDQGDLALAGEPILRLDILSTMELEIYLSSAQIASIRIGQQITVSAPNQTQEIVGKIKRIVQFADPVTRRSKVLIGVPNDIGLSPGQFAQANIPLEARPTLVVLASAITQRAGIAGVFLLDEQNIVRFRSVRIGRSWQQYKQILAGVEPGWRLILAPPTQLTDGDINSTRAVVAP